MRTTFNRIGIAILASLALAASACVAISSPADAQQPPLTYSALADDPTAAQDLQQAAELNTASLTQFQPDGRAEFGWGDILLGWLKGAADFLVPILLTGAIAIYARVTGNKVDAEDAARLREYMKSAYDFAVNAVAPAVRGKKLTVEQASPVVEWMLHYAETLFPALVKQFGGAEANRMRAWSIVDLAEGEAIPLAAATVTPIATAPPPQSA